MLILLAGLLGLALGVYLVLHAGFAGIVALLAVAGWGLLWLLPFHLLPLALDTLSWKWLLRAKARAPFGFLLWLALIRESVNGLLPVARIGGELLGIRMLSQYGVSPYVAGASVMVEITLTLVSQFLFALLGVVVLLFAVSNHLLVFEVLGFLFLSIPVMVIFFWLQKHKGLFSLVQNISKRMLDGYDVLGIIGDPRLLDAEIRSFYDKGRALLVANFWQLAGLLRALLRSFLLFGCCTIRYLSGRPCSSKVWGKLCVVWHLWCQQVLEFRRAVLCCSEQLSVSVQIWLWLMLWPVVCVNCFWVSRSSCHGLHQKVIICVEGGYRLQPGKRGFYDGNGHRAGF